MFFPSASPSRLQTSTEGCSFCRGGPPHRALSFWAPGAAPALVSWGLGMVTAIWHCTSNLSFPTARPHLRNVPLYEIIFKSFF